MTARQPDRPPHRFAALPAARTEIRLRAGFCGASGSGKSYTALAVASRLSERLNAGPLFVIDSENGSALRYAYSARSGRGFKFMHIPMPPDDYSPASYHAALDCALDAGAGVILVDGISHEWEGPNGVLEQVDLLTDAAESRGSGKATSSFSAGWKTMTPIHQRFIQRLLSVPCHLLFTVRAKIAYEMRKDERTGKMKPEKVGLGPVQRGGIEYEPDLFAWMADAVLTLDKCRVDTLDPHGEWVKPGADFADRLADWILDVDTDPLCVERDRVKAAVRDAVEKRDGGEVKRLLKEFDAWAIDQRIPLDRYKAARDEVKAIATRAQPAVEALDGNPLPENF